MWFFSMRPSGVAHIIAIKDRQYANARIFTGRKRERRSETPDQLALF